MKKIILNIISFLVNHHIVSMITMAKFRFLYECHKWPNFENPKDYNEKLNYLKFYTDTSRWVELSDKYAVRSYLENLGLSEHLVKLYGKWDRVEDIDWNALPNQFVMKGNGGSGDVVVCKDKTKLDKEKTLAYFEKILHTPFGITSAEPHYQHIKPCIIAEELLDVSTQPCNSNSMVDYKIYCFNGKPAYTWCCYNRHQYYANVGVYDMNWQYRPEYSIFTSHYKEAELRIPKPTSFNTMMNIASKLSKGFPTMRVDLYEVNGKVYFGEMTFAPSAGFINFHTQEFLNIMGDLTILPNKD